MLKRLTGVLAPSLVPSLALSLALAAAAHAQGGPPPRLDLVMKPHATGGADSYLGVTMRLEKPGIAAGAPVVRLPLMLVGIPSARYDGDALTARDDAGPLPLVQAEEAPTPQGVYRRWNAARASVGDVVVSYRAAPRKVTAITNNGPLFDLREEAGGFAGAGVGFIATPAGDGPYRVHLKWDLSEAPAGSQGVWSLGEGDVETIAPADLLSFSYYAVGPLKRTAPAADERFGMYWLSDTPFDVTELSGRIQKLYGALSTFFGDTKSSYRVFMRQNPYAGRGGTALAKSFMFGYSTQAAPNVDDLQGLVAHEITHNWPKIQGEHGDTAWYTEGTAEYYSTLISYRAGLLTTDQYLTTINAKATAYYANPYLSLSNTEAAKRFWSDPIAQTVPYGRGFMYLALTDGAIRAKTGGQHSLDDVVLELRRRELAKEPYGIGDWLALVGGYIGKAQAQASYEQMVSGAMLEATRTRFAPCFLAVKRTTLPLQLGFARASLNNERIIKDLDPTSAAAKAGVREGDHIVKATEFEAIREDQAHTMTLVLKRGDAETTVTYLPRGAPVDGWAWARDDKAPAAACKF